MKIVQSAFRLGDGFSAALLIVGSMIAVCGCQQPEPTGYRGEGFSKDATWGAKYRDSESSTDGFGVTTKAQQIEKSLGVK